MVIGLKMADEVQHNNFSLDHQSKILKSWKLELQMRKITWGSKIY